MSATPGKVLVDGTATINGDKVFVLKMIQGRDPKWANRAFFARFDARATSLEQLEPAFGERRFFFERSLREVTEDDWHPSWRDESVWPMAGRLLLGGFGAHRSTCRHDSTRAIDVSTLMRE